MRAIIIIVEQRSISICKLRRCTSACKKYKKSNQIKSFCIFIISTREVRVYTSYIITSYINLIIFKTFRSFKFFFLSFGCTVVTMWFQYCSYNRIEIISILPILKIFGMFCVELRFEITYNKNVYNIIW
jgi:hypothetical protein